MYSNVTNTQDYREFQYDLSSETNDYSTFQLKFELRHATNAEIVANDLDSILGSGQSVPGENIFPHVYDYRAIALT